MSRACACVCVSLSSPGCFLIPSMLFMAFLCSSQCWMRQRCWQLSSRIFGQGPCLSLFSDKKKTDFLMNRMCQSGQSLCATSSIILVGFSPARGSLTAWLVGFFSEDAIFWISSPWVFWIKSMQCVLWHPISCYWSTVYFCEVFTQWAYFALESMPSAGQLAVVESDFILFLLLS